MPTNIVRNPRIDVVVSEGMGSSDSLATVEGHKMSPPKSTYPSKASADGAEHGSVTAPFMISSTL